MWRDSCGARKWVVRSARRGVRCARAVFRASDFRQMTLPVGLDRPARRASELADPIPQHRGHSQKARTIRLSEHDLRDARRLFSLLIGPEGAESTGENASAVEFPAPVNVSATELDRSHFQKRAAEILRLRQRRAHYLNPAMFGEPAWDMLLVLYVNDGVRFTIGHLGRFADLSPSTTLRWVDYLIERGLVSSESHPTDARAKHVRLTDTARNSLDAYFFETLTATP